MLTLEARVDMYDEAVTYIADYDDASEVINAFVNREAITEALDRGEPLAPNLREVLTTADKKLLEVRPILAKRFPRVFMDRENLPASFWWWHLDRGIPA